MSRRSIEAGQGHILIGLKSRIKAGAQVVQRDLDKLGRKMRNFGSITGSIGLAVATPLAFATKKFADFDDAMRATGGVTQATDAELRMLTDTAKELGRTTSFTAVDVANLMTELGRAGFRPDEVDKMTGAVLNLARATGTEATLAASTMAASLRQFNLGAKDAGRVADVLTAAANMSFNSVETLAESLSYAGPVANDFNMSIEDTAALLGTLGNVGIQGSNAGTAIRRLLTLTGAEAEKLQRIFGVSFVDAAGNARPLVDVLGEVATATNGLGTAAKSAKFNEAFGLLGITGASAIAKTAANTKQLATAIKNAGGIAEKTAVKMDAGLGGTFRKLMSAAEGVQIAFGESLEAPLQSIGFYLANALGGVTEFVSKNQGMVQVLAAGAAGLVGIGGGLIALGLTASLASVAVGGLASVAGLLLSPFGLGVTTAYALAKVLGVTGEVADAVRQRFSKLVDSVGEAMSGIRAAIANGDMNAAWNIAVDTMKLVWLDLTKEMRNAWTNMSTFVLNVTAGLTQQIGVMLQSLSGVLTGLLDGYKSVYDTIYNGIVDLGGKVSGVKTIGDPTSGFDANLGGFDKAMRERIKAIEEFGKLIEETGRKDMDANIKAGADELAANRKRLDDLRNSLSQKSQTQTTKEFARNAKDGLGQLLEKLKGFAMEGLQPPSTDQNSVSAQMAETQSAGLSKDTKGTFSSFGAALSGLGGRSAADQTAKNTQRAADGIDKMNNGLSMIAAGLANRVGQGLAAFQANPLGTVSDLLKSAFGETEPPGPNEAERAAANALVKIEKNTRTKVAVFD